MDGRVEKLLNSIDIMAIAISTHLKERWDELISNVIECYKIEDKSSPQQIIPHKIGHK